MGRKLSAGPRPRLLLTTEEVARLLNVTRVTIHRWIVAGKLECTKTAGGHRRVTPDEVVRFTKAVGIETPQHLLPGPASLLLVDDDPQLSAGLKRLLESQGKGRLQVTLADDGFSAMVRAIDEKPHAILLDGVLRGLDGVQACRTLKANPRTKHIVIIAISALPTLREPFLEAGADAFFQKPFEARAVLDVLEVLHVVKPRQVAG